MESKRKTLIIYLFLFIAIIAVGVTGTYAWYASSNTEVGSGDIGKVDAKFLNNNSNINFLSATTSSKDFTIQNNSTIDTFVRIGYTIVYKNIKGEDVLQNTNTTDILSVELSVNGTKKIDAALMKNIGQQDYEKKFIVPVQKIGGKSYYYKLLPGENISGKITLNAQPDGINYPNIVLATEVIQSTEKALIDASQYGWDVNLLYKK